VNPQLRAKILQSRFLPLLVFPYRLKLVLQHLVHQSNSSAKWLFRSKEFANFTYDLTPANKNHLAWFVSGICNKPVQEIERYFLELESNVHLKQHIATQLRASRRGNEIDGQAFLVAASDGMQLFEQPGQMWLSKPEPRKVLVHSSSQKHYSGTETVV